MIRLKFKARIKCGLRAFVETLMRPSDWLRNIHRRRNLSWIILTGGIFLLAGLILNCRWNFPCFLGFVLAFLFIGGMALWAAVHFPGKIKSIVAAVANQPGAKKAIRVYLLYCDSSPLYIIVPLAVAVIFGIGGCSMFGAMALNPTLIWVLILFFLVVYISMIGYLQYIVLALYIWNLASGSGKYEKLPKSMVECVPARLDWLQDLTKLSHTYRSRFFTLGSSYIIAFGAFCWLPEMQANTSAPAFYVLWSIIFLAIVFLFPVVSVLEYRWIKKIVEQLKSSYIEDLEEESNLNRAAVSYAPAAERLAQTLCAIQIMNSSDYPLKSVWTACYAAVLSIFNFSASMATVMQAVPNLSSVFQQIS